MTATWAIRTHIIEQNLDPADLAKQLNLETALLVSFVAGDAYLPATTISAMVKLLWGPGCEYSAKDDLIYSVRMLQPYAGKDDPPTRVKTPLPKQKTNPLKKNN